MKFGCKVAMEVLQVDPSDATKNMVCSPVSISAALYVLAAGSEGPTREQLLRVMELTSIEEVGDAATRLAQLLIKNRNKNSPQISYVYALWVAHPLILNNNLKQLLRDVYKTESTTLDFLNQVDEVVNEANLWAEKQSNGLIKQIISRDCVTEFTALILTNALYFEGIWDTTFKPENTHDKDFYLLNGRKVRVPFMKMSYDWFYYGMIAGCKIIRMCYKGGNEKTFSMYIFLPDEINGLPSLMQSINLDADLFDNQIQFNYVCITELHIPKFNFEYSVSLPEIMKNLGLTHVFDKDCRDLRKMVKNPENGDVPLYASEIHHKCCVEINEEGTKAAALTKVDLMPCGFSLGKSPINFVADHPFMFMIREDSSGSVLFVGTVLDPLSN